jgi:hypothetical protein
MPLKNSVKYYRAACTVDIAHRTVHFENQLPVYRPGYRLLGHGRNHRRLFLMACDRVAKILSEKTSIDTLGSTIATVESRKIRVVYHWAKLGFYCTKRKVGIDPQRVSAEEYEQVVA